MGRKKKAEGVRRRHSAGCATRTGRNKCDCSAGWEASVYDGSKKVRKTFPTFAAARSWRTDALAAVKRGIAVAPTPTTVREAAADLVEGMQKGRIRNRSGDVFKPSVCRGYEQALRLHVLPDLGGMRLSDVRRRDVQALVERLSGKGRSPSTVRNALLPLRVIYRRAVANGDVGLNPCQGLELPAVRGRRERVATPDEAAELVAVLDTARDRALWGTALYAGLRLGELRALRWAKVDLANGRIHVDKSMDHKGTVVPPKSRAGVRAIPIVAPLRDLLLDLKLDTDEAVGYVFGAGDTPFSPNTIYKRARRAWAKENVKRKKRRRPALEPIGLHEARHTFASIAIAAGVNPKALSTYVGHSSITITLDRYGHLMPGNEDEARDAVERYLRNYGSPDADSGLMGAQTGAREETSLQIAK